MSCKAVHYGFNDVWRDSVNNNDYIKINSVPVPNGERVLIESSPTDPINVKNLTLRSKESQDASLLETQTLDGTPKAGIDKDHKFFGDGSNFFPPQAGNQNKFLFTDGNSIHWGNTSSVGGILYGPYLNVPAPGVPGRQYFVDDRDWILIDNGTQWVRYLNGALGDVPSDGWNWSANSEDAVYQVKEGSLNIINRFAYVDEVVQLFRAAPVAPYSISLLFNGNRAAVDLDGRRGLVYFGFRDSTTGNYAVMGYGDFGLNPQLFVGKWSTNFEGYYQSPLFASYDLVKYIRLADNGVNRSISTSYNGRTWNVIHSVDRADFLTPDQLMIGVYNSGTQLEVLSWKQS